MIESFSDATNSQQWLGRLVASGFCTSKTHANSMCISPEILSSMLPHLKKRKNKQPVINPNHPFTFQFLVLFLEEV